MKEEVSSMFMEEEARRGVALLNERRPGWEDRINLNILDMTCGNFCVLGQEFGDWRIGKGVLGLANGWEDDVACGFNLPDRDRAPTHEGYVVILQQYRMLAGTWR